MSKLTSVSIALLIVAVIIGAIYFMSNGSLSTVGSSSCIPVKFVDINGKSYSSFIDMRSKNPDIVSLSDADLQSHGLTQAPDGVYICK